MAAPEKKPWSATNVGVSAAALLLLGSLFGAKFGGGDAPKTEAPRPVEPVEAGAPSPFDVAEPHAAFLLKYLRGASARTEEGKLGPKAQPLAKATGLLFLSPVSEPLAAAFIANYLYQLSTAGLGLSAEEAKRLEVLIVTVPDPIDTGFGFWYDQVVESLTRAVCEGKFLPAGHWNPWERYRIGMRRKGEKWPANWQGVPFEQFPGIMLFRSTSGDNRVMVVLLVGETPNAVRTPALQRALDMAGEIHKAAGKKDKVQLIAPAFTGAMPSLNANLVDFAKRHSASPGFNVISGSANAVSRKDYDDTLVEFHTTLISAVTLRNAAVDFLKQPSGSLNRAIPDEPDFTGVALLLESNTGFGLAQKKNVGQSRWPMFLPYPLHISRLNAAYLHKRLEIEKKLGLSGGLLTAQPGERSIRPNQDLIPSLDEVHTMAVNDQAVANMTALIRQNPVRVVGILATDPEDRLFLIQRIRQECPNVDIFITGMDMLYTLPENRQVMRNVLVSTTYPLYTPNQGWSDRQPDTRRVFKSQVGQGYYNAARFHLGGTKLQEYLPPALADSSGAKKPPVWILTVGENGNLVPFAFFTNNDEMMKAVDNPQAAAYLPLPRPAQFRTAALIVLVVVALLAYLFLRRRSPWLFFGSRDKESSPLAQDIRLYHGIILFAAVLCLTPLLGLVWATLLGPFELSLSDTWCLSVIAVLVTLGWMLSLALQWRAAYVCWHVQGGTAPLWHCAAHAVLCLSAVAFMVLFLGRLLVAPVWEGGAARFLFVDRALSFFAGYSVVPPVLLLFAGFFMYGYFALKRRHLGDQFKVTCPYPALNKDVKQPSPSERICGEIHEQAEELHEDLTDFSLYRQRRRPLMRLMLLLFVPTALLLAIRSHRTWEGPWWDVLFLFGFLAQGALVLVTLMRFLAGWSGLSKILNKMALVPMVQAFDRLPRKTAALFGGYFFVRRPRLSHLAIPAHILKQLQHESFTVSTASTASTAPTAPAAATTPAVVKAPATSAVPATAAVTAVSSVVVADPISPQTANGARAQTATGTKGVVSYMPVYDAIPAKIAERLTLLDFDFMSQDAGAPTKSADHEYPQKELKRLGENAQRLVEDLHQYWPWHGVDDAFGEQRATEEEKKEQAEPKTPIPKWVEKAEDFIAIQAIVFISQFFFLLHTMALSMVWGAVMLLLAATIYPFQPEALILYLVLGLVIVVCGAVFWVFIQVNRNEIISRITNSTPNKFDLNWPFVLAVLQFLGPIVIIVGAHLSGRLRTIVEPLLDNLR